MEPEQVWQIEPDNWHVARGKADEWRIFQEGASSPESRHASREDALEAARALVEEDQARIKLHNPDGTLDRVIHPGRL